MYVCMQTKQTTTATTKAYRKMHCNTIEIKCLPWEFSNEFLKTMIWQSKNYKMETQTTKQPNNNKILTIKLRTKR